MTTKTIAFRADRSAVPQRINIGFETDNLVERLAFKLPLIHPQQTATLMLGGRQPNMVLLTEGEGQYYVDLTTEMVGAAGMANSYITINTPDGKVWNSGPFMLATGDLPDVDGEIQEHFPDAIEQMRQEIAEHRADMDDKTAAVENAAERAEDAAQRAEDAAAGITPGGGGGGGIAKEIDPTVPDWAKQPQKPTYTAEEVGAASKAELDSLADEVAEKQPKGDYALREDIPEAIPVPATAAVGQTIVVKAVDDTGKPTEWDTADMVGGDKWEQLVMHKVTEDEVASAAFMLFDLPKNYKEYLVFVYRTPNPAGATSLNWCTALNSTSGGPWTTGITITYNTATLTSGYLNTILHFAIAEDGMFMPLSEYSSFNAGASSHVGAAISRIPMYMAAERNTVPRMVYVGENRYNIAIGSYQTGWIGPDSIFAVYGMGGYDFVEEEA